jgi:hypothetical protein
MTLFDSFPLTRLFVDSGEETFTMGISPFSGCTDRPSRPGQPRPNITFSSPAGHRKSSTRACEVDTGRGYLSSQRTHLLQRILPRRAFSEMSFLSGERFTQNLSAEPRQLQDQTNHGRENFSLNSTILHDEA